MGKATVVVGSEAQAPRDSTPKEALWLKKQQVLTPHTYKCHAPSNESSESVDASATEMPALSASVDAAAKRAAKGVPELQKH